MAWNPVQTLQALPRRPIIGIVAANLVPLFGVLFLSWDLALVMLLFWLENVVIGFYSILKMAVLARWASLMLVPFFIVHFGGFSIVHLVFVVVLFVGESLAQIGGFLRAHAAIFLLVWLALMASHGVSFRDNFLRRERQELVPTAPMGAAYKRVMVLHFTIVLGAVPVVVLGEPRWALALLTLFKLPLDLGSHALEHRKTVQAEPTAAAVPV